VVEFVAKHQGGSQISPQNTKGQSNLAAKHQGTVGSRHKYQGTVESRIKTPRDGQISPKNTKASKRKLKFTGSNSL